MVGIIILNYNNAKDTLECCESVEQHIFCEHMTIIVDNNSTDDSYNLMLQNISSTVVLLRSDLNLGYAGGNNIGIRFAIEHNCDYICVLNNDTLVEADIVSSCINILKNNAEIGFIGPAIVDFYSGKVQSTGGKINIFWGDTRPINNGKAVDSLPEYLRCSYVGGACIICSVNLIKEIGFIPENYFLFYEETEWCYKAQKVGYKNICYCRAHIRHKGSVSINKITGLSEYLRERNRMAFIKRNSQYRFQVYLSYIYLCMRAIVAAIIKGPRKFNYISYYSDGIMGRVDLIRYPFIIIHND